MHYDPMIGKLIVWATTREFAVERMRRALDEYKITGVKTNIAYLGSILELPEWSEGLQYVRAGKECRPARFATGERR